jgi:hypothetical protein
MGSGESASLPTEVKEVLAEWHEVKLSGTSLARFHLMAVCPQISYLHEPAITHAYRRCKDGRQRHRRAYVSQLGVGDPVTAGGHQRCVRGGW